MIRRNIHIAFIVLLTVFQANAQLQSRNFGSGHSGTSQSDQNDPKKNPKDHPEDEHKKDKPKIPLIIS